MIFSIFWRKGDFAEMCTTIERELGCEGLGVPKIEEKSKKNDAKMMLEKVMQKSCQNDAKLEPKWKPKSINKSKKSEKRHAKNDAKN